jgi:hypothetical protein
MDYTKALNALEFLVKSLNEYFDDDKGGKDE